MFVQVFDSTDFDSGRCTSDKEEVRVVSYIKRHIFWFICG